MKMRTVYRLEDEAGVGPFDTDEEIVDGYVTNARPCIDYLRYTLAERKFEQPRYAFRSIRELHTWEWEPWELSNLLDFGYTLAVYRVPPDAIVHGGRLERQTIFDLAQAVRAGEILLSDLWPTLA